MRHADFPFRIYIPRHVDVWCPPDYSLAPEIHYPAIYMHGGQQLFDPEWANGGEAWEVDRALLHVIYDEHIPGAILVGVWNSPQRYRDYLPYKPLAAPEGRRLMA